MKRNCDLELMRNADLFEVEGGFVTTAPQLGIFVIAGWLKSLFS